MKQALLSVSLCTFALACAGCQKSSPAPSQTQSVVQSKTADQSKAAAQNCEAISDPAQAEDCRFWKKVEAEKKRNNVNNVVKHNPGSIKQP